MIRICLECGAEFKCSPSDKKVTCSPECRSKRRSRLLKGRNRTDEERKALSMAAAGRDMSEIQKSGTEAAKASPKAGRFVTNSSAKGWVLLSPEGVRYRCTNLMQFIREHAEDFGISADDDISVNRIHANFQNGKRNAKAGKPHLIYGWVLVEWDDRKNCEKILDSYQKWRL